MVPVLVVGLMLLVSCPVVGLGVFLLWPAIREGDAPETRIILADHNGKVPLTTKSPQSAVGFHEVGIAALNYDAAYGGLPIASTTGPNHPTKPPVHGRSLGWRVGLLPYLDQDPLYRRFDLNADWDSPANRPLAGTVIGTYADPLDRNVPNTRIRAVIGPGTVMDPAQTQRPTLAGITDGADNTIMFIQSADRVPWPQFNEVPIAPGVPIPPLGLPEQSIFLTVTASGSVRPVAKTVDPNILRAMATKARGDFVEFD